MAVNAKQTATGTVRAKTASPWGIMAGRSRGSQVKQHNFYIHFSLSQIARNPIICFRRKFNRLWS
jgi:hypothetical protein